MLKQLLFDNIAAIVKKDGGQSMKQTMKWKNVRFKHKSRDLIIDVHVADLQFDDWSSMEILDSEILAFYDLVNRQYNKAY